VLIPGFFGFDAIGQVEYYAGVTTVFDRWRTHRNGGPATALHYFDNFPTAAVVTRAARLGSYLAKRIARGEIAAGDEVSLVGHSTGGLDIRCLIGGFVGGDDETRRPARPEVFHVDGGPAVSLGKILDFIRHVVFLSVPHWGTNIADWVKSHWIWREAVLKELSVGVAGVQIPTVDRIEEWIAGGAACLADSQLLLAVQDSLSEANGCNGRRSDLRRLDAHEAASQLALFVGEMASDFRAIDDLASERPESGPLSPAHFKDSERRRELELWRRREIQVLSFASLGSRPFRFPDSEPAPLWELTDPRTYPELSKDPGLSQGTDLAYRLCYRACAGGPFRQPILGGTVTRWLESSNHGTQGGGVPPLETWDDDGIVNTLSMLWPVGENVLVPCDHLDIVGHYQLVKAQPGAGRKYQAYDALGSTPRLSNETFNRIWTEIFDFCA
jgi:hypothetical protein